MLLACEAQPRPPEVRTGAAGQVAPESKLALGSSTAPAPDRLQFPEVQASVAADYPGLHNVVAYGSGRYSGAVPEGEAGFASLSELGVKTIISVDGAVPEVDRAAAQGMRYVHLPIGYDDVEPERALELARALRDLPGPVYLHCHHGKHRSAAALGVATVLLSELEPQQALERMKVSGTAPNYTGLFRSVTSATPASKAQLDAAPADFPCVAKTNDMVQAMVAIDEAFEDLKSSEEVAWGVPDDHPDLVPAAQAGRIADLLRQLSQAEKLQSEPQELRDWLRESSALAQSLEDGFVAGNLTTAELSARMKLLGKSCKDCHAAYRD